ncbi:hypothetical protein KAR91_72000 [Candidatus Pacearchaeota archaeon]|nr:hypothetical protein [Candidatus Pacearchaeota archaeon]
MKLLKKDGYFLLAIGFVLWVVSSYVSLAMKHQERIIVDNSVTFIELVGFPFLGDIIFKVGTMLVILGVLIILEKLLTHDH